MKTNAQAVLAALENDLIRDEYRPAGLFIPEVQAPGSDRRADLIWMTARTAHITGYEIKVTRADLLSELRDPTKCEPWLKYCDRWWLAVGDASLVDGLMDRIPDDWGVCTPPTSPNRRMMTVLKEAPALTPADKAPVLGKLISHQAYRNMELQRRTANAEGEAERLRDQRDSREEWRIEQMRKKANPYEETFRKVGDEFNRLKRETGSWGRLDHVPPETIARAILNAEQADALAKSVKDAAEAKARVIEHALEELGRSREMRRIRKILDLSEVAA